MHPGFLASKAFTLAEVLITLGIIGVVAALTLPTLIQNYQEKATVTKLKKFASIMNSAITMSIAQNGPVESWDSVESKVEDKDDGSREVTAETKDNIDVFLKKYILPYLKYSKSCNWNDRSCSKPYTRHSLDGTEYLEFPELIILADGMTIPHFWISAPRCNAKLGGESKILQNICGEIAVDVNGRNAPNKIGEDVFYFYFTKYGMVPQGAKNETHSFENLCDKSVTDRLNGYGCAAWVLQNENLDYLHCREKLGWDKASSCK